MDGHNILFKLFEEKRQAGKEHACGKPFEESIYEIKGHEQIGGHEIDRYQNRIVQGGGRIKLQQRYGGELRQGV
jgi:hypothetical protein